MEDPYRDIGAMMEVQLAIMQPWSKTGIRMARTSTNLRGQPKLPIMLSAAACLWLSRKVKHVG